MAILIILIMTLQFHYDLIVHQRLLNHNRYNLYNILMIFDELSNNNKIKSSLIYK
jgi:hypothetical protein